jgi:hypothetical protein
LISAGYISIDHAAARNNEAWTHRLALILNRMILNRSTYQSVMHAMLARLHCTVGGHHLKWK